MKKILVLTSLYDECKKKFIAALPKEFSRKVDIKLDFLENFSCLVSKNKLRGFISGIPLSRFNLVYFSGKKAFLTSPKAITMCLESNNIPFSGYTSYAGSKLTSLCKLAKSGINIPDTVFCSTHSISQTNKNLIKKLGFPLIIKDLYTHRMKKIYAIKTKKELQNFLIKHPNKHLLFQKFINIEKEYRILTIDGKAYSAYKIVSRNYKQGKVKDGNSGQEYVFVSLKSLPQKMIIEAGKAGKILSLDIAGVDICINQKGRIYIFEVNRSPEIDPAKNSPEITGLVKYFSKAIFT